MFRQLRRFADLARIYSLCNRVDGGLVELKAALKDHIEEHFTSAAGERDERVLFDICLNTLFISSVTIGYIVGCEN